MLYNNIYTSWFYDFKHLNLHDSSLNINRNSQSVACEKVHLELRPLANKQHYDNSDTVTSLHRNKLGYVSKLPQRDEDRLETDIGKS